MAVALLVAAGSGERLGAGRPKAFVVLAGRPMLEWSLEALRAADIDDVVVAAPLADDLVGRHKFPPGTTVVAGGATRSESVRAALEAAPPGDVVVHDAARPLVTAGHFRETLAALAGADCAVAAAPITDTVKEAGPDRLRAGHARPLAPVGDPDAAGVSARGARAARWRSTTRCWRRPPTTPGWSSARVGRCGS